MSTVQLGFSRLLKRWCFTRPAFAMPDDEMITHGSFKSFKALDSSTLRIYFRFLKPNGLGSLSMYKCISSSKHSGCAMKTSVASTAKGLSTKMGIRGRCPSLANLSSINTISCVRPTLNAGIITLPPRSAVSLIILINLPIS